MRQIQKNLKFVIHKNECLILNNYKFYSILNFVRIFLTLTQLYVGRLTYLMNNKLTPLRLTFLIKEIKQIMAPTADYIVVLECYRNEDFQ